MNAFRFFSTSLGEIALYSIPEIEPLQKRAEQECARAELELCKSWHIRRQRTFLGGRIALRQLLLRAEQDLQKEPILADERGAPLLPPALDGSISHKDDWAAALFRPRKKEAFRGLDVELLSEKKRDVARYVLTDAELLALAQSGLDEDAQKERVLRTFSLKEALYKALDRFVKRYVGFKEVEVNWQSGLPEFHFFLKHEPKTTFAAAGLQLDFADDSGAPLGVLSAVEVRQMHSFTRFVSLGDSSAHSKKNSVL